MFSRAFRPMARRTFATSGRAIYQLPPAERVQHMKLLVCDMAGTTVEEGGLVYTTLQKVMNDAGLKVSDEEMLKWHGAQKTEVLFHFAKDRLEDLKMAQFTADKLDQQFDVEIRAAYFTDDSPVRLIRTELLDAIANLRASGCKFALNTGYPTAIQQGLLDKLQLREHIDAAVCSADVGLGRPFPYMTQLAMKRCEVMDVATVAKAGDTTRDIEEGLNAGCGLAIGVLSGAGKEEGFRSVGADLILPSIVEFEKMRSSQTRLYSPSPHKSVFQTSTYASATNSRTWASA